MMKGTPTSPCNDIAYIIDPRFPGGTSAAVVSELRVVAALGEVKVHAITSKMFGQKSVSPKIRAVLRELDLQMVWDAPQINADLVIWHNPSFLKFQDSFASRIMCRHLIVVTHENFYRPGQVEAYDVGHCHELIDKSALALRKSIAPISPYNRETVLDWFQLGGIPQGWDVLQEDWFNICDFDYHAPTEAPRDRRGRHSRPGMEKFPNPRDMMACFPAHAESNVILGADLFINSPTPIAHWDLHPFGGLDISGYFEMIDFMVYFTAPTWRESFGRVLAEAIAAGKVVISDPGTAATFGGGVIGAAPKDVDAIIGQFLGSPEQYQEHVTMAQSLLRSFAPDKFRDHFLTTIGQQIGVRA